MKDVKKKSNSGVPLVIIVLVLVGVVGGAYYLYSSAKKGPDGNTNTNGRVANATRPPVNAPIGANPPNMLGSPTAAVTVEEFADFQCGSCAAVHPVMKEIQSIYGSKIKLVFRNYPLANHDKAYDAAVVAEAAGMQGKFWQMQDQLFSNQATWASPSANAKALWSEYAQKIGLDVQQFQNDVVGMAAKNRVEQDMGRARVLGVGSTPTIFINGESIPFQMANVQGLRSVIDQKLQEAASQQQQSRPQAPPANSAPAANNSNSK